MSFFIGTGSGALQRANLAGRPFSNSRPTRRLPSLLWALAALATLWNLFLFAQYWRGSSNGRDDLRAVRAQIDERVDVIRSMQSELGSADLSSQNEHVRFLNRKIAERTFPWSRLFDDLAAVLPRNVRLDTMAPSIPESKTRRGRPAESSIDWIDLRLEGTAKTSEDILQLVDAMFSAAAFASPVLTNERDHEGQVDFDVRVRYRIAPTQLEDEASEAITTGVLVTELDEPVDLAPGSSNDGPSKTQMQAPELAAGGSPTAPTVAQATTPTPTTTSSNATRSASALTDRDRDAQVPGGSELPIAPRREPQPDETVAKESAATERPVQSQRTPVAPRAGTVGVPVQGLPVAGTPVEQKPPVGQDPKRGQRVTEDGRRIISADDLPPSTREAADRRFGNDRDVAPRVDNASRGGGGA